MIQKQIQIALDDAVRKFEQKFGNLSPLLPRIASLISKAIDKNFTVGGRWSGDYTNIDIFSSGRLRWKEWSPDYAAQTGLRNPNARLSINTYVLFSQIEIRETSQNQISISTNVKKNYAVIHQFGGTIHHPGGTPFFIDYAHKLHFFSKQKAKELEAKGRKVRYTKAHTIIIPPRPYIVLTPEDLENINNIILSHINKD